MISVGRFILLVIFIVLSANVMAQDIELKEFRKEFFPPDCYIYRDLTTQSAVIFLYSNKTVNVEADMGVLKKDVDNVGFVIYYVPAGTNSISISYKDYPVLYYEFTEPLEAGKMYTISSYVPKKKMGNDVADSHINYNAVSQDISISDFRRTPQSLIASMMPEYDNMGKACAVIRYTVDDDDYVIEPNLGAVVTKNDKPGEIIQYVPQGTKRLTVRNGNYMPIRGYEIPVEIESKATYDVTLSLSDHAIRRQKASPDHDNYLGIGYNNPELKFSAEGGTRSFTIHCNSSWDISAPSWCQLSESTGLGVKEITVKVKRNNNSKRTGVISVTSEGLTSTIGVEQ